LYMDRLQARLKRRKYSKLVESQIAPPGTSINELPLT
jgi:hypothetical protein